MKFNIGDKVYCKKSLHYIDGNMTEFNFIANNFYTILEIPSNIDDVNCGVYLGGSNNDNDVFWFYEGNEHWSIDNRFYDYFYTKQELRKRKLNKINENN
jgi:hypothetical protein